ncbi:TPA: hypothetical protein ACH3X1_016438 [Trebouxia sp. C0004]
MFRRSAVRYCPSLLPFSEFGHLYVSYVWSHHNYDSPRLAQNKCMECNLLHLTSLRFSALTSVESSSFLFAHLCSDDTKHTAPSQAVATISAPEASTFAAE